MLPYLVINIAQIVEHDGSFIHFSKREAVAITIAIAVALCVVSFLVLALAQAIFPTNRWLLTGFSFLLFATVASAVEPTFWYHLLDLLNDGFGEWILRTGMLATMLTVIICARVRRSA